MSYDPDIDFDDDETDYDDEADGPITVTTVTVDPHSPMGIVASYHATMAHTEALTAVNAKTMDIAPAGPPIDARELTLAEVAHGQFPDLNDPRSGSWLWPIPVTVAAGDSADLGEWTDTAATIMRGLAVLYAHGYRLHGPPVITPVSGIPTDDEAVAYLAGRGLDPADVSEPNKHGGSASEAQVRCGRALREQWPDLLIPATRELVQRVAARTGRTSRGPR